MASVFVAATGNNNELLPTNSGLSSPPLSTAFPCQSNTPLSAQSSLPARPPVLIVTGPQV